MHSLCDRNGNTKLSIISSESKHMKCACAKQTKHLGEVLGVLGKHTSQEDYRLLLRNGLLAKLSQAAWLWNTRSRPYITQKQLPVLS